VSSIPDTFFDDIDIFNCPICLSDEISPLFTPATQESLYNPSDNSLHKTIKVSCDRFHPICQNCYMAIDLKKLSVCCICRKPQDCFLLLKKNPEDKGITPNTIFTTEEIIETKHIFELKLQEITRIIKGLKEQNLSADFLNKNRLIIFNKINYLIKTNKQYFFQVVKTFLKETIDYCDTNPSYLKDQINILIKIANGYKKNKDFLESYNNLKETLAITTKITNNEHLLAT
jgi:hypothetical protein